MGRGDGRAIPMGCRRGSYRGSRQSVCPYCALTGCQTDLLVNPGWVYGSGEWRNQR